MVTRYCNESDAKDAVKKLHNYRIRLNSTMRHVIECSLYRPNFPLAVTISVDNRRLVARLVPAGNVTEAEVTRFHYSDKLSDFSQLVTLEIDRLGKS